MAFLIVLPIALTLYPVFFFFSKLAGSLYTTKTPVTPFSRWFEFLDDLICSRIALHKTPGLFPIRQLLVRASRVAGTNMDIVQASEKMMVDLDEVARILDIPIIQTVNQSNSASMHEALPKQAKRKDLIQNDDWSENTLPKLFEVPSEKSSLEGHADLNAGVGRQGNTSK